MCFYTHIYNRCMCMHIHSCVYIYIYIYIGVYACIYIWLCVCLYIILGMYIYHHHHHVVLVARISLTLSHHFSLSFITSGRSSGLHPYPHIVAECIFVLVVLLLLGHMRGSIRVHHLWVHPCFSSSVLHVWFV